MHRQRWLACVVLLATFTSAAAQTPLRSGLPTGVRPGPYSALVCTGPQRGQQHCFICETEDRPAVIVFARSLSDATGKLAHRLDRALADHKAADLRAWVTLLADDHTNMDPKVVAWAKQHAVGTVPVGVFEDVGGPPSYRLTRDADVTVLLSVKQRVVANFAFRAGELTDARIDEVMRALPRIVGKK